MVEEQRCPLDILRTELDGKAGTFLADVGNAVLEIISAAFDEMEMVLAQEELPAEVREACMKGINDICDSNLDAAEKNIQKFIEFSRSTVFNLPSALVALEKARKLQGQTEGLYSEDDEELLDKDIVELSKRLCEVQQQLKVTKLELEAKTKIVEESEQHLEDLGEFFQCHKAEIEKATNDAAGVANAAATLWPVLRKAEGLIAGKGADGPPCAGDLYKAKGRRRHSTVLKDAIQLRHQIEHNRQHPDG